MLTADEARNLADTIEATKKLQEIEDFIRETAQKTGYEIIIQVDAGLWRNVRPELAIAGYKTQVLETLENDDKRIRIFW